jgi:hypothetical protein
MPGPCPAPGATVKARTRKPTHRVTKPKPTKGRRGRQFPFETEAQALIAWNAAVASWNGDEPQVMDGAA